MLATTNATTLCEYLDDLIEILNDLNSKYLKKSGNKLIASSHIEYQMEQVLDEMDCTIKTIRSEHCIAQVSDSEIHIFTKRIDKAETIANRRRQKIKEVKTLVTVKYKN